MPKISVTIPHQQDVSAVIEKIQPALEKTTTDFQGQDLSVDWQTDRAEFQFKSLGFTIKGNVTVDAAEVTVNLELPFAAMMYKEKAKKGITKNITAALAN
jgi:hypothetical protein